MMPPPHCRYSFPFDKCLSFLVSIQRPPISSVKLWFSHLFGGLVGGQLVYVSLLHLRMYLIEPNRASTWIPQLLHLRPPKQLSQCSLGNSPSRGRTDNRWSSGTHWDRPSLHRLLNKQTTTKEQHTCVLLFVCQCFSHHTLPSSAMTSSPPARGRIIQRACQPAPRGDGRTALWPSCTQRAGLS